MITDIKTSLATFGMWFSLCPVSGKVVSLLGFKSVYEVTGSSKEQVITLCTINAAGATVPPMHVFPGERFRGYNPMENCVTGAYFGRSPKGWITTELFYGWITNHFYRHVCEKPVLLLVDGHRSHIDVEVSKFCKDNDILLYCLPPYTSHMTQPLDVGFFKPLKVAWAKARSKVFAEVFKEAWINAVKMSNIVNAFKATGTCPFDIKAICPEKYGPSKLHSTTTLSESQNDGKGDFSCLLLWKMK